MFLDFLRMLSSSPDVIAALLATVLFILFGVFVWVLFSIIESIVMYFLTKGKKE